MSPRSPEVRSLEEQASEEDEENQYDEHAPEGPEDNLIAKESLPEEETTSDELTSRRPPSPFECFLEKASDSHVPFPPKKIIRAFEDSLLTSDQHDEVTQDHTSVHEFHDPELVGQTSPKDTHSNVSDEADEQVQRIPVDGVADVATELDENSDAQDIMSVASPEQAANLLSRLTFWWINSLMWTGFKKPLEIGDLPSLPDWDDADVVHKKFTIVWNEEQQKSE